MFKIIGGILLAIIPVNGTGAQAHVHHKPPFHCITKGKHHPEICVPKFRHPHH